MADLENIKINDENYEISDARTRANISDAFDPEVEYAEGDYCIYEDVLYKFTEAHTGDWDPEAVEQTTVGDELGGLQAENADLQKQMYYQSGDSIEFSDSLVMAGQFQTSGTVFCGSIFLPKPLADGVVPSLELSYLSLGSISGSVLGSTSDFSAFTITTTSVSGFALRINIARSTAFSVSTFTPGAATMQGIIKFT